MIQQKILANLHPLLQTQQSTKKDYNISHLHNEKIDQLKDQLMLSNKIISDLQVSILFKQQQNTELKQQIQRYRLLIPIKDQLLLAARNQNKKLCQMNKLLEIKLQDKQFNKINIEQFGEQTVRSQYFSKRQNTNNSQLFLTEQNNNSLNNRQIKQNDYKKQKNELEVAKYRYQIVILKQQVEKLQNIIKILKINNNYIQKQKYVTQKRQRQLQQQIYNYYLNQNNQNQLQIEVESVYSIQQNVKIQDINNYQTRQSINKDKQFNNYNYIPDPILLKKITLPHPPTPQFSMVTQGMNSRWNQLKIQLTQQKQFQQ